MIRRERLHTPRAIHEGVVEAMSRPPHALREAERRSATSDAYNLANRSAPRERLADAVSDIAAYPARDTRSFSSAPPQT